MRGGEESTDEKMCTCMCVGLRWVSERREGWEY